MGKGAGGRGWLARRCFPVAGAGGMGVGPIIPCYLETEGGQENCQFCGGWMGKKAGYHAKINSLIFH